MSSTSTPDRLIYQSPNFTIEAPIKPLVDRQDGGHLIIHPVVAVTDRQQLTPELAIELMRLTIVAGQVMCDVMRRHGVDIGRINYQDNGNWSVFAPGGATMHIHLYGRAISARIQRYGEATFFPHRDREPEFYSHLQPLQHDDLVAMRAEVEKWLSMPQFSDQRWGLTSIH